MSVECARLTLRQFVSANLADGVTDFHSEAERLVKLIPAKDRDAYLVQALVGVVGEVSGQRRRDAFDALNPDGDAISETSSTGANQYINETHPRGVGSGAVSRVTQMKTCWDELLNAVGLAADGGRKRVGDMTAADLESNIAHREQLARENHARADQFRVLHKLLTEQGVQTVSQIEVK